MAELNELFEEAIGRAQDLSQEATDAMASVRTVVGGARTLSERVSERTQDAVRALDALGAALDAAERRLTAEVSETATAMDELAERAGSVRQTVTGMLDRVRAELTETEEQRGGTRDRLTAALQSASDDAGAAAVLVQKRGAALGDDLDAAEQAIADLNTAVAEAQAELTRKQGEWAARLAEMTAAAQGQAEELTSGLGELLTRQSTALLDLGNHLIAAHNGVMETVTNGLAVRVKEELEEPLDALCKALEAVGEASAAVQGTLGAEADGALGKVKVALPVIDQVRTVLALTAQLG